MQNLNFRTALITTLMILTIPTNALPSRQPEDSNPALETLERRVIDESFPPPHICRDEPLPDVDWDANWPDGITNSTYKTWSELCFTKADPGNVGCGCVNFQPRAYCSPFLGMVELRVFGRLCERKCNCIPPTPFEDFDLDDEDISAGTTGRSRLGRGRSSSSRGFASLLSSSSVASLSAYEADSDSLFTAATSTANQQQCSAGSCHAMTDCGDECICGLAVQKYVSIDPLFAPWSCVAPYAKQALVAVAVGSVSKHTRPRTHHRPSYIGLGGRDLTGIEGEEGDDEYEDEPYEVEEEEEEVVDGEVMEWACPCNGTFAHGACCETREGEVWNVPNLLHLEI